jgi:DNA repair protein SbcC/Rad50
VELEELRAKGEEAFRDRQEAELLAQTWRRNADAAAEQATSARARIEAAQRRLADAAAIKQAVTDLERLRGAVAVAATRHLDAKEVCDAVSEKRVAGAEERIHHLRGGFGRIVAKSHQQDAIEIASISLLNDDKAVELAKTLPDQIEAARRTQADAFMVLERERQALEACERLAARAPDLDLAHQDLAAARADLEAAEADHRACVDRERYSLRVVASEAEKRRVRLHVKIEELELAFAEADRMAQKAKPLAAAQARIEELQPQLDATTAEVVEIGRAIAALGPPPEFPLTPDVEGARLAVRQAERVARDAAAAPPVRMHALEKARESAARIEELTTDRRVLESELADWVKLSQDLGRNGLQAYEVDAVGPELTELVNDLLHTCIGPKWTVSIETQRNSADGKRTIEGCEVHVLDTERGREASAGSLSGGERVLVSEAISLALSMLACRRSGVEGATLIRDETGAALDPVNGRAYVAMLRKAADIVGARQVLFVSHSQDVQELADARIHVADGKVVVE